MKIAINGKMCSGKTTTSQFIIHYFKEKKDITLKKVSFADKVYELAYELFNMKEKDRRLLQAIGTKMREIDENVWINSVLNKYDDNIILDDARYLNEIEALKNAGFVLIKLDIPKDEQLRRLKKCYPDTYNVHINNMNHESETSMDNIDNSIFDIIIKSDNNILENLLKFMDERF